MNEMTTDRQYWEALNSPGSIIAMDKVMALVQHKLSPPRVAYNRSHVAFGTKGNNFGAFRPSKRNYCHLHLFVGAALRDSFAIELEATSIYPHRINDDRLTLHISVDQLKENEELMVRLLREAQANN